MLQVIEHTPTRLVLRDQRKSSGIVAAIFTLLSIISLVLLIAQGVDTLFVQNDRDLIGVRLFGFGLFTVLGLGFVLLGMMAYQHFMKGVTLIFDREVEQFFLQTVQVFRTKDIMNSIYSISHIEVKTDERMRVFALFLALRTGERLPICTMSTIDEDHVKRVLEDMRSFLRKI